MKKILGSKLRFMRLAIIMLATILTVFPLSGGFSPATASALNRSNLQSNAGTSVIHSTDLFVTADGSAPVNGVDSISVSTIETLLNNSTNVDLFTDSSTNGGDITIAAPIAWSTAATLTIDAFHSIFIDAPITINNISQGGLNLITNDGGSGGTLAFDGGNINFASGSGNLTINGNSYPLISDINGLNSINSNPNGYYALAHNIDASSTSYTSPPVSASFTGTLEGLGNTISNLSINAPQQDFIGLFSQIGAGGEVTDLSLTDGNITGYSDDGILVGDNYGTVIRSYATGSVTGYADQEGGLVGYNVGVITQSYASVNVTGINTTGTGVNVGGLVGSNDGSISQSYSSSTTVSGISNVGGLVGESNGSVANSYTTGQTVKISGGPDQGNIVPIGGLVGNNGIISNSYTTSLVVNNSPGNTAVGGLVGINQAGTITTSYFSTDGTGQTVGVGLSNDGGPTPGVTGLTTAQLQKALPAGLDPTVWGYETNTLGQKTGLPVLLWQIVPSFAAGQPGAFETYVQGAVDIVKENPQIAEDALFGLSIALSGLPVAGTGAKVAELALVEASESNGIVTVGEAVLQREGAGVSFGESTASQALRTDLADASANTLAEQECFVCTLKDITVKGGRVKIFETNVTLSEFGQELIDSGYTTETRAPGVTQYIKDNTKYVLRTFSSDGRLTAEYYPDISGHFTIKYRLLGP